MIAPADVLSELERRYSQGGGSTSEADIRRWTEGSTDHEEALYDSIGAELARGYHERRYSFAFCDQVVNDLYGMIFKQATEPPPPWPKLFWRVYLAFDAGEFHRKPDGSDDPIAEFTDLEIADIVRGL